jgi:hypothetical protein
VALRVARRQRQLIDPRDTYANRDEAASGITDFVAGPDPIELVVYDRYGKVESREQLP